MNEEGLKDNVPVDIIIYTTTEKLLHKQGKLKNDPDHSDYGEYFWKFGHLPKGLVEGQSKVFFAVEGNIQGFFIIEEVTDWGVIYFNIDSWREIETIPLRHFQGFKYAHNVPELKYYKVIE